MGSHLVECGALALEDTLIGHFLQQVLTEVPLRVPLEGRVRLRLYKPARLQVSQDFGASGYTQGLNAPRPETPAEDRTPLQDRPFRL